MMMAYEEIWNAIGDYARGGDVRGWDIVHGVESYKEEYGEEFPFDEFSDEQLLALNDFCEDVSDSYAITRREHNSVYENVEDSTDCYSSSFSDLLSATVRLS